MNIIFNFLDKMLRFMLSIPPIITKIIGYLEYSVKILKIIVQYINECIKTIKNLIAHLLHLSSKKE